MFLSSSKVLAKSPLTRLFSLSLLGLSLGAASASAAVPAVAIDGQQVIGAGFNNPQAITTNKTNLGAVFIADTNNNQIVALLGGYNYGFQPEGFTLSAPEAVFLDSKGDLFIGDTPSVNGSNVGRVIEMPADGNGNLTGGAQLVFQGAPLTNPTALTVDSSGTIFIADFPPSGVGAIYSLAAGGTTPQLLNITGPPAQYYPAALVRDSGNNLYFADNGNLQGGIGGVYVVAATGGTATQIATPSFVINQPSGLALAPSGDLYILTILGTGGSRSGQEVLIVPAASPSTPYILPTSGIVAGSSMAFDQNSNLDVVDSYNNQVDQVSYISPTNMGYVNVGSTGPSITFNFEFNAPATLRGFQVVTQGDTTTDLTQASGGTCANGAHNRQPSGGQPVSASNPYTCVENYEGTPTSPGPRTSAIQVKGTGGTILAATPAYLIGFGGVQVTYPLDTTITASNLLEPQAVAISGADKNVYVADTAAGKVYSTKGLNGTTLTPVSTGSIALQAPIGLAVDAAGDLFIADFNLGEVVEVPTTTGLAPSVVNTGGLLQHPIALTVDSLGNLYVGDAGPGGYSASNSNPGYIVKVPSGGGAFKMSLGSVTVVYPQALSTDFYNNYLFVGDGGDLSGVGQVVVSTPDGSMAGQILGLSNVTNPDGLAFDPAGNLYILDGTADTITVDPIYLNNPTPYQLNFDNTKLAAASAMAISSGGQSFVISNLGGGTNDDLVLLNGNRSTLAFGSVPVGTQSQPMTATVANIGNGNLTLGTPYYSSTTSNPAFSLLNSTTCTNDLSLVSGGSCAVNFEFTPTGTGQTNQKFTFNSNAYNTGVPILTVQGTGK